MQMRFQRIKKFFVFLGVMTTSILYASAAEAQDSTAYLRVIAQNTTTMVRQLNNLPSYLQNIGRLVLAWISPDNSETTATIQGGFTRLGNLLTENITTQASLIPSLNNDLLNNDGSNVFNSNIGQPNVGNVANSTTLGYANDLVYSTLLGKPFFEKDPRVKEGQGQGQQKSNVNSPYNYIRNASGVNIFHQIPAAGWGGSQGAKLRYQNYFNTVTAVESFNAYALSQQYADGNRFNDLQTTLIKQATDPQKWFAQVASENIGFVLRQILLYESQVFVLLTQLIQLQKQTATAQVMTNSLLIAINQSNEGVMLSNAKGQQPSL